MVMETTLNMGLNFVDITDQAQAFFDIIPHDWQEDIVPYWPEYRLNERAKVMALIKNQVIIGGGIIFSSTSPDDDMDAGFAQSWFDQGYLYIGFLWIEKTFRNQKLGSLWLKNVFELDLNQKYWLTIEEENLIDFYVKNQFRLIQNIDDPDAREWLMVKEDDFV